MPNLLEFARKMLAICLSLAIFWPLSSVAASRLQHEKSGEWDEYDVWLPDGEVRDLVFLFSPETGIQAEDRAAAEELTRLGLAVALVDSAVYLRIMGQPDAEPDPETCLDTPGAFVWVAHYLQKKLKLDVYRPPYLAGRGAGAALAYIALAQSPKQAFAGGVGAEFQPYFPARRTLCQLRTAVDANGQALENYRLGAAWRAFPATPQGYPAALAQAFGELLREAEAQAGEAIKHMPVVEVAKDSSRGILAVIYSGDGGWRDIDKRLGEYLDKQDIAVLGVDVLSYFWEERSPDEVGRDLASLLSYYRHAWNMRHVVLMGYSFGADILPFAYRHLPPEEQRNVVLLSLLAPGRAADFEIQMTGWFGGGPSERALPIPPELQKIDKAKVQCVYGEDEASTTLCTHPAIQGAEILKTAGDHHFDGDYEALGAKLAQSILRRIDGK